MSLATTVIEPISFREALGHYASGITVITSEAENQPLGFTCQSFYSVSMDPPLVSFSVKANSYSYPHIRQAGRFAVNILSGKQAGIANQFARQGSDKWRGVKWQPSPLGNPLIDGSLHWLDCEVHAEYAAGDHLIVIGEVKALKLQHFLPPSLQHSFQHSAATQPLLYFKGQYCSLAEPASL
ncbi:MAG: flavin reductase family protein [Halopseudomonas sp.]|uniref:flavin reductase family protein n=1 Tax=Halopseudomonas sp. TaxID=2901191 RepID=UPI0030026A84